MQLTMERLAPEEVEDMLPVLRPIYRDAYSEPPYEYGDSDADEFVARVRDQCRQPNFTFILGRVEGTIAGFSYGFTFEQDRWWRGAKEEPPRAVASGFKFAVIELVVQRESRGNGFSKVLLQELLAKRDEKFAILLSTPGSQANAMYKRWGWGKVGEVQSYPHWPVDDALVLALAGDVRESQ